jgi:hypothetical protein
MPACTVALVRHRRPAYDEWLVNTSFESPPGFRAEHYLGVVHMHGLEGTARVVTDSEEGYAAVARGGEPDAEEMARTLGYVEQVAFPLLEPLKLCRHASSGTPVLTCGEDDCLLSELETPPLAVLGWLDRLPVNPRVVPTGAEATAWLRGLVRGIDSAARRHRVALGEIPRSTKAAWELGALFDRDPGGGIPVWIDGDGRLHTPGYAPTRHPFSARRTLHWATAPAVWLGVGGAAPRARSVARRSLEALRFSLIRPGLATAPIPRGAPQAWLLPEAGQDRIAIFSAIHAVRGDQLVTRDPSEARELGYDSIRILGYALSLAPVTGTLAPQSTAIPWGSHFGEALTRSEDPCAGRY